AMGSYSSPDAVSMPPSWYPGSKGSYIDAVPTMLPPVEALAAMQRFLSRHVAHASRRPAAVDVPKYAYSLFVE
ncbi:MAG: hypothetical protein WB685_25180, partial [Pseudolabrys sp.]